MTVLVAYATCHGSTRGVAERIGERLEMGGLETEVRDVADVVDATRYAAAVVGSAIHAGAWLPEGAAFVTRVSPTLRTIPVWLFSVSTVGDEESMFPASVAARMRAMRKETPELTQFRRLLRPVEHRNFAGAVSASHWPLRGRAFFRATGGRYGDHRNWAAIDAWGDAIAARLALVGDGGAR